MDIIKMTTKKWYQYLIDQDLLKEINEDGTQSYSPCRVERLSPDVDWKTVWSKARCSFLSSTTTTFIWKLLHDLLTTEERLSNTLGNIASSCRHGCIDQEATLKHCFFKCHLIKDIGSWILNVVRNSCPLVEEEEVLLLNFSASNPLLWITANALQFIWTSRLSSRKASLNLCLIHLKTEAFRLSETIHEYLVPSILAIIDPDNVLS